ncbi:Protein gone early [Gryllus bimaculatus]|nr:Protein gone early [Gryllus bimaculatus]
MDPTTKEWKLQHLYESCMRLDSIETDGTRPLIKLIFELGGWIVLPDFHPGAWNMERTIVKLFETQQITPFFQIDVVPDPRNPSKNIVKIIPGGLDLPHKSFYSRTPDSPVPSAFMQFLRDIVALLGARSSDAKRFSTNMFYYQQRLATAMPDNIDIEDPVASSHRDTIGNLREKAGSIPLMDILQLVFPKAIINNETEVLVPSSKFMNTISSILSTTDRGPLNEYMMWVVASSYIPYLNFEVRDIEMTYHRVLTGAQVPAERWETCITTLEKYMGLALAALVEQSSHNAERDATIKQINQMFDNIRDAVRSSLAKAYWFDKELQELALQKINTMSLQVGVSSSVVNDQYLKTFYNRLQIQRNDFFRNIRNAREFQMSYLNKKLMEPQEEYKWIDAAVGKNVAYIPTANKIVVPQWMLSPPLYNPQYPTSVQYGGLGVEIAYAVVSAVLPPNILFDGEGVLLNENSTVVNHSATTVRRAKAFVVRDVVQNGIASQDVANKTALTSVIHIAALRQAHMSLCSKSTPQQMDIDLTTSQHLNGSQL